jgi:phage-related protein
VKGVVFETQNGSFNSLDYGFRQAGFVELNRVALDPVSAKVPGGSPLFFPAQEGQKEFSLSFAYVGRTYRADVGKFVSRLYNSRSPVRVILPEEDDRFYVGFVTNAPTVARSESIGTVEMTVSLVRNYALRRWTDEEINPENSEITFDMPIVPGETVYPLHGSFTEIPYYNDGIDIPPILEVEGTDFLTVSVGGRSASYMDRIYDRLVIDFEKMTAKDGGRDVSGNLTGDQLFIPSGESKIMLFYQKPDDIPVRAIHDSYGQFQDGTLENLALVGTEELSGTVQTIQQGKPVFTRASVGYNEDGLEVPANSPRLSRGKFTWAARIEQAVTQLFQDADFENLAGPWVDSGITKTTRKRGACRIVSGSSNGGTTRVYLRQDIAVVAGDKITVQVDLQKTGPVDYAEIRISWYDSAGTFISRDIKDITAELSDEWKTHFLTATAPANAVQAQIYPVYDGATLRTNFNLEASMPMCTKTGYVWGWHKSGTKAAEYLKFPAGSMLNPAEGSLGFWVYEDGTGRGGFVWDTDGNTASRFLLYRYAGDSTYNCWINGSNPFGGKGVLPPAKGWHYWEARWKDRDFSMYLDGSLATLQDSTPATVTLPSPVSFSGINNVYVGCKYDLTNQWNSLIDDFRISSKLHLPGEEYNPNLGERVPVDEKTAYLMRFDRNLATTEEDGQVQEIVAEAGGRFTSPEVNISTNRKLRRLWIDWEQSTGGSVEFETSVFLNGEWTEWTQLGHDGTVKDVPTGTALNGARLKYRANLHAYDASVPMILSKVTISASSEREGSVTVKGRKRFG